jgi:hypothetical protein
MHLKGWEYYQWIDSFLEYFEKKVSFDAFLVHIDWRSVETQIRANILREKRIQKKAQPIRIETT